jgi:polar amino acid transport system permease protein
VLVPLFNQQAFMILSLVLVGYLVLSLVITAVMRLLERWAARRVGRRPSTRARLDPVAPGSR